MSAGRRMVVRGVAVLGGERLRSMLAGVVLLAVGLAGCDDGDAPAGVSEVLTAACADARDRLAAVPAPVDGATTVAFLDAADRAATTVRRAAEQVVALADDRSIADLVEHLRRLPAGGDVARLPGVAYEASAAIIRIDALAAVLEVPQCGAATWRPAVWRALAVRDAAHHDDHAFRRALDRLCADTFPEPALLTEGLPLLRALAAGPGQDALDDPGAVKARVLARLNTVSNRPAGPARFLRQFSRQLPEVRPSEPLATEYVALLAAFMRLDVALPSVLSTDPSPEVRDRVYGALDELEEGWQTLDITCRAGAIAGGSHVPRGGPVPSSHAFISAHWS